MPTSSTSIITGDPTGNINSILASNGYDKTGDNRNNSVYARVLNVFEDKSITYELLVDNLGESKAETDYTGSAIAYPYSKTIGVTPLQYELVRLINGPEPYSTSNLPAQPRPRVYYEPTPLSLWQDVNNNIVLNNKTVSSNPDNGLTKPINIKSYVNNSNGF